MRAENLERRLDKLRAEYWEGLERRVSNYNTFGYSDDKRFTKWEGKMNKKLIMLRAELAQAKPEKYHFGRMNNSWRINPSVCTHSKYGDNGLMLCLVCRGLFEWNYKNNVLNKADSYTKCEEHKGQKSLGSIRVHIKEEDFCGI